MTGYPVKPALPTEAGTVSFSLGSEQVTCFGHWNILTGMRMSTVQTSHAPDDLAQLLRFHHLPGRGA